MKAVARVIDKFKRWIKSHKLGEPYVVTTSYVHDMPLLPGVYHRYMISGGDFPLDMRTDFCQVDDKVDSLIHSLATLNGGSYLKSGMINHDRLIVFTFDDLADVDNFKLQLDRRAPKVVVRVK